MFSQCILGLFASIGVICILKEIYAIIVSHCDANNVSAVLLLKGDGTSSQYEIMLLAACQIRELYFPFIKIVFTDEQENPEYHSIAKKLADKYHIIYKTVD